MSHVGAGLADAFSALTVDPNPSSRLATNSGQTRPIGAVDSQEKREHVLAPWMEGLKRHKADRRHPLELLNEELDAFVTWIRPTNAEHELRLQAFRCFESLVKSVWPFATCELFGSMATGLYLPDGDFDVVITDARLPTVPSVTPLRTLRSAILQSGFARPHEIRLVDNAKVPLVKFRSTATFGSFDFDVSFNSPKGPLGARESLRLLEEVERKEVGNKGRARMMILLLKVLLAQAGLNEVRFGGLGGLSIFCLGVSFVQLDRRDTFPPSLPGKTALDALSFFSKYARSFDYRNHTITTANGGGIIRKADWLPRTEAKRARLSIVHPVDPQRDLSSGSYEWQSVHDLLFSTTRILLAYAIGRNSSNTIDPTRSALAAANIVVSPSMLERRRLNERLVASGELDTLAKTWNPASLGLVSQYPSLAQPAYRSQLPSPASGTYYSMPVTQSFSPAQYIAVQQSYGQAASRQLPSPRIYAAAHLFANHHLNPPSRHLPTPPPLQYSSPSLQQPPHYVFQNNTVEVRFRAPS